MGFKPEGTATEAHVEALDAKGRGYSPGVPWLAGGHRKQEGLEERGERQGSGTGPGAVEFDVGWLALRSPIRTTSCSYELAQALTWG